MSKAILTAGCLAALLCRWYYIGMIPLVSVFNLISFVIVFAIFVYLWLAYRKSHNIDVKYFSFFYLFAAFFQILIAVPGLFSKNELVVAYTAAFAYFFLYIALAHIISIPVGMLLQKKFQKFIFYTTAGVGLALLILNIIFIKPALRIDLGSVYFYLVQEDLWIRLSVGMGVLVFSIIIIIFFIIVGRKLSQINSDDRRREEQPSIGLVSGQTEYVRENESVLTHQSYIIAAGFILLLLAAILNFVIQPSVWSFIAAGFIAIAGWITIALGITTK